jgi:hypothetical protein
MKMIRLSEIDAYEREIRRDMAIRSLYHDPLKWIGRWMLGKVVYLVYLAISFVLFISNYVILRLWRDK